MSDQTPNPSIDPEPLDADSLDTASPLPEYDEAPRRTALHPLNVAHLVMGLVFLAIVGAWALIQADVVAGDDIRWLLPLPWVLGGTIGLAATAASSVRRHSR